MSKYKDRKRAAAYQFLADLEREDSKKTFSFDNEMYTPFQIRGEIQKNTRKGRELLEIIVQVASVK